MDNVLEVLNYDGLSQYIEQHILLKFRMALRGQRKIRTNFRTLKVFISNDFYMLPYIFRSSSEVEVKLVMFAAQANSFNLTSFLQPFETSNLHINNSNQAKASVTQCKYAIFGFVQL